VRAFWRRDPGLLPGLSERLMGSPVQFDHSHRPATSSVNFIAAHDGFTMWDTVSYDHKHNEANGEDNRDGHDHNLSDNMGHEGETEDAGILKARVRRVKGMLATLFLSHGVPMLLAGDEMGQTQGGNNNAYCQDNETTWIDWEAARPELVEAVAALTALRREWRTHLAPYGFWPRPEATETIWLHPEGRDMSQQDWRDGGLFAVGMRHHQEEGPDILVLVNAGEDCTFTLPSGGWELILDTARDPVVCAEDPGARLTVEAQSVAVLRAV
jgi:isoamylase